MDPCEYTEEGSPVLFAQMKAAGLVAVFGASDDLAEFRGAIDDEVGTGTIYLTKTGLLQNDCDNDDCPYFANMKKKCAATIVPVFADGSYTFTYKTSIPHETFEVIESVLRTPQEFNVAAAESSSTFTARECFRSR